MIVSRDFTHRAYITRTQCYNTTILRLDDKKYIIVGCPGHTIEEYTSDKAVKIYYYDHLDLKHD